MELYGCNDKAMSMQCTKQISFNAWSRNLDHTKIMQQHMSTMVNAPKLVHLYPFNLPKLKSILWYPFVHKKWHWWGKRGLFIYIYIYDKLGVELVWNT